MVKGRLIISDPSDGPGNMAIDEAIFISTCNGQNGPTLRLYTWANPCITMGYFQSYRSIDPKNMPITRRLTGGLAVDHHKDLSYSFSTSAKFWPSLYDQMKTYQELHDIFRDALASINIKTDYYNQISNTKTTSLCTESILLHDLNDGKNKILGSCQRRRGNNLIVQGSIHNEQAAKKTSELSKHIQKLFINKYNIDLEVSKPTEAEILEQKVLITDKYNNAQWNTKNE